MVHRRARVSSQHKNKNELDEITENELTVASDEYTTYRIRFRVLVIWLFYFYPLSQNAASLVVTCYVLPFFVANNRRRIETNTT